MATDRQKNRNFWASYGKRTFAWIVSLDCSTTQPDQLLWWVAETLAVLWETGIYKVYAIPEIGYANADANGRALSDFIAKRFLREGVIDLLFFGHLEYDVATTLSYHGEGETILTEDCKDLAVLQMKTQPWLNESSDSVYHRNPFLISGARFSPDRLDFAPHAFHLPTKTAWIRFETYTDIWLPVVHATNEWDLGPNRSMPNTVLARLNGSRLNTALQRMREITLTVGGTWRVDEDYAGALALGGFTETGVNLSGT